MGAMRRALQIAGLVFALALAALFTLDLRHAPSAPGPTAVSWLVSRGRFLAGSGQAEIHVPYPVVPAGYGPKDRHDVWSAAQPQMARAISVQVGQVKLTLVSVDLLEIDSRLMADLAPRLPRSADHVWVCATHTHSGMGNYDPNPLAQLAGTGRFKKAARDALLAAIRQAVTQSRASLRPATLSVGSLDLSALLRDRSRGGDPPGGAATRLAFATADGGFDAVIWGAHPTKVPRPAHALDADFPAALRPALFFQGAGGNASLRGPLDRRALDSLEHLPTAPVDAGALTLASGRVGLPPVQIHSGPRFTRRAAANLVGRLAAPRTAPLDVARLGPLTLIAVPGEPTAAAGRALQKAAGDPNAIVMGLCNGYVGYIETPDRVKQGIGESKRQYFDSSLLARFTRIAKALAAKP